ncbi:hypothetical protein [Streptomyces sp. So13.3]|uniref:hypothetical protein n=1 Tax=Streptomyces TaxID=1883 RepID=UPI00164E19E3|nr:hypothetical protein [Streptomyces sp. So13.3]
MHARTATILGVLATAALLAGCDPNATSPTATPTTAGTPGTPAATTTVAPKATAATPKTVPNFVGKGLQSAQDAAQAAGFYNLASHDAAGRDRHQILDLDWQVCSQAPAAGTSAPVDTKLDFGAVKTNETCPASDQKAPAKAGKTMPNFKGKALNTATAALDPSTSIDSADAAGDRMILVQSNWKVCTQSPTPGTALTGQPVKFTAVKFEETCP